MDNYEELKPQGISNPQGKDVPSCDQHSNNMSILEEGSTSDATASNYPLSSSYTILKSIGDHLASSLSEFCDSDGYIAGLPPQLSSYSTGVGEVQGANARGFLGVRKSSLAQDSFQCPLQLPSQNLVTQVQAQQIAFTSQAYDTTEQASSNEVAQIQANTDTLPSQAHDHM